MLQPAELGADALWMVGSRPVLWPGSGPVARRLLIVWRRRRRRRLPVVTPSVPRWRGLAHAVLLVILALHTVLEVVQLFRSPGEVVEKTLKVRYEFLEPLFGLSAPAWWRHLPWVLGSRAARPFGHRGRVLLLLLYDIRYCFAFSGGAVAEAVLDVASPRSALGQGAGSARRQACEGGRGTLSGRGGHGLSEK